MRGKRTKNIYLHSNEQTLNFAKTPHTFRYIPLGVQKNFSLFARNLNEHHLMTNTAPTESNLSGLKRADFQAEIDGKKTDLFILKNAKGMEVAVTNYGCAILSIMVPDKNGKYDNVVLGHDSIEHVVHSPEPFLNTTIGRYGNRIADARFTLLGEDFTLADNAGGNSLHGGPTGFHTRVWDALQLDDTRVEFKYTSADGEEGFPGKLEVTMSYFLSDDENALNIEYSAKSDKNTIVNLTNHAFFNLAGTGNPTSLINDHVLEINAAHYLPMTENSIPTGEILSVEGTPMDFLTPHTIGERIEEKYPQLIYGHGYDHCYVLNKVEAYELSYAVLCTHPTSGRTLTMYTTEPGVQLYTGNWLSGFAGAHGATYPARSAVCFEAQDFPNSPNVTYFPSPILLEGDEYAQFTSYVFDVVE
jgi:aldose 1-epimerase